MYSFFIKRKKLLDPKPWERGARLVDVATALRQELGRIAGCCQRKSRPGAIAGDSLGGRGWCFSGFHRRDDVWIFIPGWGPGI